MTSNKDGFEHHEEDIDRLKFRNEIEAFARLKGLGSISGLYDNSINDKVSASLGEVYHEGPCLSLESPGDMFSSIVNKSDNVDKQYDNNLTAKLEGPIVDDIIKDSDHISWDAYFMNVAVLASLRSKDTTKVGSVLVLNKKLVGMGYNGFPSGVDESKLPTSRVGPFPDVKYAYTIHSEQNCILNSPVYDIKGATLYVTLFPCNECVKLIIQKGISEIVYISDKHHDDPPYVASRRLLSLTNIVVRQYNDRLLLI